MFKKFLLLVCLLSAASAYAGTGSLTDGIKDPSSDHRSSVFLPSERF